MKKRINRYTTTVNHLNNIEKNSQIIAKNSSEIVQKIDNIEQNTKNIAINSKSKLPLIVAIITLIVTIISAYIAYLPYKNSHNTLPEYKIYLSSEYTKLKVNAVNTLTATLSFDADSVIIRAYLNSSMDGDVISMTRYNETEWHKKVYFEHIGTYEVIATAIAPNGETIETSIEIDVVP